MSAAARDYAKNRAQLIADGQAHAVDGSQKLRFKLQKVAGSLGIALDKQQQVVLIVGAARDSGLLIWDKVLEIETGHKTFQIKSHTSAELAKWHLRLQEVIMLQEKVANVAHGWLLKEENATETGGGTQLRHYWFVLFSNGILMYFTDPNRAVLGQSCGFIPVENCAESSQSSKQHTLLVKCTFDQWLLATNSKENMLQWAASLHAAKPSQQTNKQ